MLARVIFIGAALLFVSQQNADAIKKGNRSMQKDFDGYVDINGTTFYVDSVNSYTRDEAKIFCDSLSMKLLTFDNDDDKWSNILIWLNATDLAGNWFWTSGMRDEESTTWYWETTGAEITDFNWATSEPTMNETLIRSCINFNVVNDGWADDDCIPYNLDAMCE